jgi:cysteinyl-tRNA synthetase
MWTTRMPELFLHNSLTRRREAFAPRDPAHVRLYLCGPTVYDLAHLGNARPVVVFDVLVRLLRRLYPRVTYVRNITDVDDKINARAAESGEPIAAITARTTEDFHADMAALGALPPDREPRATGHIAEMIELIERLIAGGHAYVAEGHVLFAVASYPEYGRLSGRTPAELLAGARVDVAPYKREPGDFVLWKPSPPDLPGWDSPWGRGRPGWHIECSAMSWRYLGTDFDIHGGGQDLLFPHHENERAQSCCAFPGSGFARVWLHNGMLLLGGEKMSKSLGNFLTVRDLLARGIEGEVIRFAMLRTHYRATLDFTDALLRESANELDRFYRALHRSSRQERDAPPAVLDALCDDLNSPQALVEMRALADRAMKGDPQPAGDLLGAGKLLGILGQDPLKWLGINGEDARIQKLVDARTEARRRRDFAEADRIRNQLLTDEGVTLEDHPDGSASWLRRRSVTAVPGPGSLSMHGGRPLVTKVDPQHTRDGKDD